MKHCFLLLIVIVCSCKSEPEKVSPQTPTVPEKKNELPEQPKIESDTSNQLPAVIKSTRNAKFKVVEIIDSTYVKVILLDIVNREDFEEVENAVLKTREKFELFDGVEATGKLFFKFYSTQEHYEQDALPAIASTFYNTLSGKTGMDIYWGRSTEITKIICSPERRVIQK